MIDMLVYYTILEIVLVSKDQLIVVEGIVEESLPNAIFKVVLIDNNNKIILAHTCGKMRRSKVRILVGDTVVMEVSKHDLTKGRIVRRKKTS